MVVQQYPYMRIQRYRNQLQITIVHACNSHVILHGTIEVGYNKNKFTFWITPLVQFQHWQMTELREHI
jgi:hypothetical protein